MDHPNYEFIYSDEHNLYSFISKGTKGYFIKLVQYQALKANLYNLAFGDWSPAIGGIDDKAVTDNGDMEMVISTVVQITKAFLRANPGVSVQFRGSTSARTRLYQIVLNTNYHVISQQFEILGLLNGKWHKFEKNVNYEVFLVSELL
ncbi:hypothetical protein SAMN04487996_105288 [Dyadobacter soli]|uniref:Uncharacterized protein n=1 Tax=Dyadobacter soli TaxID=659014 RepID=A0A1G7DMU2_9BACT|nr:hypothetical protein [Dyadobacter soli]SDE52857.1 hypothetical protein SAMN04487996_105288 [Dyadobacter soli]